MAIQTSGYIYAGKEDYEATIGAFERAIATGDLPPRVVSDLTYGLAQLHLAKERPRKSLQLMDQWFAAQEKEPGGDPYALKAQIHLILDELRAAEQAIKKALSKEEEPKQQWTRILLSVLLQEERYGEARPILKMRFRFGPVSKRFGTIDGHLLSFRGRRFGLCGAPRHAYPRYVGQHQRIILYGTALSLSRCAD